MRRPLTATLAAIVLTLSVISPASAVNPIITSVYTADPAALVVGNTLYVYTGHDEAPAGGTNFVMRDWMVLSTTNATNWTNHGSRLGIANFPWAGADAWAAEVEPRNGRYYWYVSINGNGPGWMDIGVAVGDSPLGPFRDARGGPLISDSTPNSSGLNIDPTVFVDDDGQA
jgi:beta-xylosidase